MNITRVDRDNFFETVKNRIKQTDVVADIGCGIRPQTFIEPKHHICFDPHKQYLEHLREKEENNENLALINTDWKGALELIPEDSVETLFLLDVIEHLEKDKALELVEQTKKVITNQMVIFTPFGFIEQNHEDEKDAWGLDGGKWQEHKSGWLPEDFGDGWEFIVCEKFHTHDNLGVEYETPKGAFFAIYNAAEKISAEPKPYFSVVVPTYNHADYLGEALDSLIAQSFPFWEAIVVNDGSTDNTLEVLEEYSTKDSRIKYFDKENGGVSSALNVGLKNAVGKWICWLSSDDYFENDKLEVHVNAIIESPNTKFHISMWSLYFNEAKRKQEADLWAPIPVDPFRVLHLFHANYIHGNSIAVERSVIEKVGYFDEKLLQGQDFDYWMRILMQYSLKFLPVRTCTTRLHEGQTTNQFFDGGVFDSTYSLIKNAQDISFAELFPKGYLNNFAEAKDAINEAVTITSMSNAFIHKLGHSSFLIDKIVQWLNEECPDSFRSKLIREIKYFVKASINEDVPADLQQIINKLLNGKYEPQPYDLVENTIANIRRMIENGEQQKAISFERFLLRSSNLKHVVWDGKGEYKTVLYQYWDSAEPEELNLQNIVDWRIAPKPENIKRLNHQLKIQCQSCNSVFKLLEHVPHSVESNTLTGMCPNCKTKIKVNEEEFKNFIALRNDKLPQSKASTGRIAFFVKETGVVGGGTKIVFKHINWLSILGVDVTLFSYNEKPKWAELDGNFKQISEISEINFQDYEKVIAFSIFDIPEFLKHCPKEKVTLFCQGYEGYHFGDDYDSLRADKFMLTQLHTLPFNVIGVSTHLVVLFKRLFDKSSHYIPNGIDLSEFHDSGPSINERKKSITFIGNPFHMLKGFNFLFNTIAGIQRSKYAIKNLELNVVFGFQISDLDGWIEQLESIGIKVNILIKLKHEEISRLLKETKLLAVTSMYEGFSLPILEAMASGTPVISTKNLGAESFCVDGQNSLLVEYNNFEQLAEKILTVFYNEAQVKPLVKNAFATVSEYTEYNSVKSFVKSYSQMLGIKFDEAKVNELFDKFADSHFQFKKIHGLKKEADIQLSDKTSIILVAYNQVQYTLECIQSVKENTKADYEIIVVDNNSSDDTVEKLGEDPKIKLIRNAENLGFPKAVNLGIKAAAGRNILILNNDTIVTNGWLERMLEVSESDEKIGIVGPISNIVSGVQVDKDANYKTNEEMIAYAEKVKKDNEGEIVEFPRVAFLCTLIKREVIDKIGGLDERFTPGNYEDDDFCLRAQLAGYKTVITKDVFIHHYGSKSFGAAGEKAYADRLEINRKKFVEKWGADPNEIWLKGKQIKSRGINYPINRDEFVESFTRAILHSEENELDLALLESERAANCFENCERKGFEKLGFTDVLSFSANLAFQLGDLEKAKDYFESELKVDPESARACLGLAEIFNTAELYDEAKIMYEWSIKNGEKSEIVQQKLESVNHKLGLKGDDLKVNISPSNEKYTLENAEELINNSDLAGADEILNSLLKENPKSTDVLNDLAVVRIMQKNYETALEIIQEVISIDPSNETALGNLQFIEQEVSKTA